jgi:hypothetical protein
MDEWYVNIRAERRETLQYTMRESTCTEHPHAKNNPTLPDASRALDPFELPDTSTVVALGDKEVMAR